MKPWMLILINECIMCKSGCESVKHLLLQRPTARELWSFAVTAFGVTWAIPSQMIDLLTVWRRCLYVTETGL